MLRLLKVRVSGITPFKTHISYVFAVGVSTWTTLTWHLLYTLTCRLVFDECNRFDLIMSLVEFLLDDIIRPDSDV